MQVSPGLPKPDEVRPCASRVRSLLRLLSHRDRLLLMMELARSGRACVGELEERLGIRQPTLSQQLGILRQGGVLVARREGRRVWYQLASDDLVPLLAALSRLDRKSATPALPPLPH